MLQTSWLLSEQYEGALFLISPNLCVAAFTDRHNFLLKRRRDIKHGQAWYDTQIHSNNLVRLKQLLHTRYCIPLDTVIELIARLTKVARLFEKLTEQ